MPEVKGLDRRTILDAALALIDEQGLSGLTMRKLGERLGASPMAAYRHFADRAEIMDALADETLSGLRLNPDDAEQLSAEDRIVNFAMRGRRVLLEHPALVAVIAARPLVQTVNPDDLVSMLDVFREVGFSDEDVLGAIRTLVSVSLGMVLLETARMAGENPQVASEEAAPPATGPEHHGRNGDAAAERIPPSLRAVSDPESEAALIREAGFTDWAAAAYEMAVRDCFEGLKRRAR